MGSAWPICCTAHPLPGRVLEGYAGAVVVTTVVVTIGTDPFSIYHFHHIAL